MNAWYIYNRWLIDRLDAERVIGMVYVWAYNLETRTSCYRVFSVENSKSFTRYHMNW